MSSQRHRMNIILAALAVGIFFSCQNEMKVVNDLVADPTEPVQTIEKGEYIFTERGRLQNKLSADVMKQYVNDSSYIVMENNVKLRMFDKSEVNIAVLTADKALYYETRGVMEAQDSVVLANSRGETLVSDRLVWLQDSSIIYSHDPITIYRSQGVIYGDGIVSNEAFTKYSITKPRGQLEVESITKKETNE